MLDVGRRLSLKGTVTESDCMMTMIRCAGYIHTSVSDGPGCLTLRCPGPSCHAAVGEDMVLSLVSDEDRMKYNRYLLRSYVEDNRKVCKCFPVFGAESHCTSLAPQYILSLKKASEEAANPTW